MKSISIEELEKIDPTECCIVDIRPEEQYRRGTRFRVLSIFPWNIDIWRKNLRRQAGSSSYFR